MRSARAGRRPRVLLVLTLGWLVGLAALHATAPPASAECFGETDPWPSFRAAVPTAQRIIAGEVVNPDPFSASTGYLASFKVRVTDVLRGPVPAGGVLDIVELRSGLPTTVCADSFATLLAGDVIAIAFDALGPDGTTRINTIAFLRKAGESNLTAVEDITRPELEAIALSGDAPGAFPSWTVLVELACLVLLGSVAVAIRIRASSTG